ncbi:DUF2043 domain-containing protein [Klebsiella huaxiensis]|nr:DUF2043 domain-containing protein [Klebsiella huaxiensis]
MLNRYPGIASGGLCLRQNQRRCPMHGSHCRCLSD